MKRIVSIVLIILCVSLAACSAAEKEPRYNAEGVQIAAVYNEEEILTTAVDSWRTANMAASSPDLSDREIVDRIIEGMILTEEAERRGIAATQDEIDEMVVSAAEAYALSEGKAMLDPYFEAAGIDFEGYLELLREIAPGTIAKQKLLDEVGREYCEEHGLEFSKVNPPEELTQAQNDFVEDLVKSKRNKIEYYIE